MMSEKRFFTKTNKNGRLVIIDKECHIELIDLTLACEVLNRLDLKLKTYNEQLGEQQITITALKEDKAIAEDYANIFEKENVKLRKKLNNYKATVLGFVWIMEQNGRISGKDDKVVKDLFKLINDE